MTSSGVDVRLELLADGRRRRVLRYLRRGPRDHASVDELTEQLRTHRRRDNPRRMEDDGRLRIDLVHRTLPKLTAHGLLEWDRRGDVVRYREDELVEAVLDAIGEDPVAVES